MRPRAGRCNLRLALYSNAVSLPGGCGARGANLFIIEERNIQFFRARWGIVVVPRRPRFSGVLPTERKIKVRRVYRVVD